MTRIVIETDSLRAMARTIRHTQHELDGIGSSLRHVAAPRPGFPPGALGVLAEVEDVVSGLRHTAGALEPWARQLQRTADVVEHDEIGLPWWACRPGHHGVLLPGGISLLGAAGFLARPGGGSRSPWREKPGGGFDPDVRREFESIVPWLDDLILEAVETVDDFLDALFGDLDRIVDGYCDATQPFFGAFAEFIGYLPTAAVEYAKGVAAVLTDDPSVPWYGQLVADLIPYSAIPRSLFGFGREVLEGDVGGAVLAGAGVVATVFGLKAGWAAFKAVPGGKDIAGVAAQWGLDRIGVDEWINDRVDDFVDSVYDGLTGIDDAVDTVAREVREFSETAKRTVVGSVARGTSWGLDGGRDAFAAGSRFLQAGWKKLVGGVDWLEDRVGDVMEALYEGLTEVVDGAIDIAETVWREATKFAEGVGDVFVAVSGFSYDVVREIRLLFPKDIEATLLRHHVDGEAGLRPALRSNAMTPSEHLAKVGALDPGQAMMEKISDGPPPKYVVYLRGIDGIGSDGDPNYLINAAVAMGGWSSYEAAVLDMLSQQVPPGAEIVIVGHSQGGIAAMNLAANEIVNSTWKVEHILTAGSPVDLKSADPRVWDKNIVRLSNLDDGVTHLDGVPRRDHPDAYEFAGPLSHDVDMYANELEVMEGGHFADPGFDRSNLARMTAWMDERTERERWVYSLSVK